MKLFTKRMHRGEKGFTLIELLVVIAILGIIAAVVALNVGTFFGRGTLQAANTELHQCQTAIIAAMADAQSAQLDPDASYPASWQGEQLVVQAVSGNSTYDAADYVYGLFRATYLVEQDGSIIDADPDITGGWGPSIMWESGAGNWILTP